MPAVLETGSMVNRIIVSERGALAFASQSRASMPMNNTLTLLPRSQVGGGTFTGAITSGMIASPVAIGVPSGLKTGPPTTIPPHEAGAMPGRLVIVQQAAKPRAKIIVAMPNPMAMTQKMMPPTEGRLKVIFGNFMLLFFWFCSEGASH